MIHGPLSNMLTNLEFEVLRIDEKRVRTDFLDKLDSYQPTHAVRHETTRNLCSSMILLPFGTIDVAPGRATAKALWFKP
jgi:hypothetical protein